MKTVIIAIAMLVAGNASFAQAKHSHAHANHPQTKYTCTMHPEVVRNKPGKCPKCGMKLVKMKGTKMKSDNSMGDMKM